MTQRYRNLNKCVCLSKRICKAFWIYRPRNKVFKPSPQNRGLYYGGLFSPSPSQKQPKPGTLCPSSSLGQQSLPPTASWHCLAYPQQVPFRVSHGGEWRLYVEGMLKGFLHRFLVCGAQFPEGNQIIQLFWKIISMCQDFYHSPPWSSLQ